MNYSGGWALRNINLSRLSLSQASFFTRQLASVSFLAHVYWLTLTPSSSRTQLVVSIPCAFLVVVVERESMLCFLLINVIEVSSVFQNWEMTTLSQFLRETNKPIFLGLK